ncbi:contractile injection system protein, VgrG/Pvc8 family [Escherichia fergusonii]|uniref:contractile injection system protein, VgrG/Pvc8 family n=1 Tax=Escherichia fergusonii TaxID=564 RepID=UPI0020CCBF72|nr:contractile injection system protein, VgrG/Pvc8 family [Escherichia fergusonii]MCP9661513.1 contractile injection system protein, VgrG/Pvc8 family [Escherichia fergusonii]
MSESYLDTGYEAWKPNFFISADNTDITEKIRQGLINITLTDYGGSNKQSDEIRVAIVSETLKIPARGVKISIGLGFGTKIIDKGIYVVDSASSGGEPRVVDFTAKAAPMNSAKGAATVQSKKTRSWIDKTVGDIVSTIATENGLVPRVSTRFANKVITQIDQVGESDMNLLSRLATRFDAVSKPAGGYWVFLPRGKGESVSGAALQQYTLKRNGNSSWGFSRSGQSGDSSGGESSEPTYLVKYHDTASGEIKELRTGSGGDPVVEWPATEPSLEAAREATSGLRGGAQKKEFSMNHTIPASLELVALTAECNVITEGFGSEEDRAWTINSLTLSLGEGGFSVQLNLE